MFEMTAAGALFVVTHFVLSSAGVRAGLVGRFGELGFQGVYSVVALITLGFCIFLYVNLPRLDYLWYPNPDLYWVAKLTMPLAAIFLFGGFLVKNPTQVGNEKLFDSTEVPAGGLMQVTRHPFMWGVVIWSIGHLAANGDQVSVPFFATFLVLAAVGTFVMDAKKKRTMGEGWSRFAAVTSNIPFAALATGRAKFAPRELVAPVAVGLVAYALMYFGHEWLSGVPLL